MKVAVFGAGAWGTAIAHHAAARHEVLLWARDPALAGTIRTSGANERYLPGVRLHASLECRADIAGILQWLDGAEGDALAILGTSMAGLRPVASALAAAATSRWPVAWLCKGIERETGALAHQVLDQAWPAVRAGVLSGPSFAQEVAAGLPVALTIASPWPEVRSAAVDALHHGAVRIYSSEDVLGVELGGAFKNIMAIAAGISDGLGLGHNARAALITRGLAEITRLGRAAGAQAETFNGLTGLGDLVLTCTGELSRNRRVGMALAAGRPIDEVIGSLGHVAEGVACIDAAAALAAGAGVEMPIVASVQSVLSGRLAAREAVMALLAREPKREH